MTPLRPATARGKTPDQPYPLMVDMRLLPGALATWVGTWVATGILMPVASQVVAVFLLGGASACGVWWWRDPRRVRIPSRHQRTPPGSWRLSIVLGASLMASGLILGSVALADYQEDPLLDLAAQKGRHVSMRIRIQTDPVPVHSRWSDDGSVASPLTQVGAAWVDAQSISVFTGHQELSSSVLLMAEGKALVDVHRGDVLDVIATIDTSFRGAPPYVGIATISRVHLVEPAGGWLAGVNRVRQSLRAVVSDLPPDAATLITGMSVGDDALMRTELRDAMRTSSLTHLTAVSGSHVAVLLSVVAVLVPGRGLLKAGVVLLALACLIAVVGPEPSIIRSALMAVIMVWGMVGRRGGQAVSALAAVAIVMMLGDPWCARSFGFVLSVLATWGVVVPAARAQRWVRRVTDHYRNKYVQKTLRAGAQAFIVAICAQAMVQPVMFFMNPWIPTWGVVANVLAAPAVAPTCIAGLGAAAFAWLWPDIGHVCAMIASPFAAWIGHVGVICAELPGSRLPWHIGVTIGIMCLAVLIVGRAAIHRWARGMTH